MRTAAEQDLAALFDVWTSGEVSLDAFLDRVLAACVHWFEASGVSLFLRVEESREYVLQAQAGPQSHVPDETVIVVGKGIAGEAIQAGHPVLVQNKRTARSLASAMVVPLATPQSGCIGVLNVSSSERKYRELDLQEAATLSRYVALAVNNTRLLAEQTRAQEELARVTRLAEIGQMTAAIAHEIRNPLTGIRSAAQMIQAVDGESKEFAKIIEDEALKLNALCDQFLEFARPMQVNLRTVSPAEIARAVCEQHRSEFAEAGVGLELSVEEGLAAADPLRLEQILRNLLLNALQACKSGAVVEVFAGPRAVRVADSGIGIDAGALEKLFIPFFTTKPQGTGLGLSTVRKIVDAHGWRIEVQSTPGEGTTFALQIRHREAA